MKTQKQMENEISNFLDNLILNSTIEDWNNDEFSLRKDNIIVKVSSIERLFDIYIMTQDLKEVVSQYNYDHYKWWEFLKKRPFKKLRKELIKFRENKNKTESIIKTYNSLPLRILRKNKLMEIGK